MVDFSLTNQDYEEAISALKSKIVTSHNETYVLDFRSEYANSKIIRDFVGAIFDAYQINHPWRGRFILITDELINNSIEHGSEQGDMNRCIIHAGKKENEDNHFYISLEVHDTGRKKMVDMAEIENIKKNRTKKGKKKIYMEKRGRGLFHITEKIVDKLSFSQSEKWGLAVKIEKCIVLPDCPNKTPSECEIHTYSPEENTQS